MKNHWSVHVVRATVTIWQNYAFDDNVHINSIRFDQSQSKKSRQYWNGDKTSHLLYSFPNVTVVKVFAQRLRAIIRFDSKTRIGNFSVSAYKNKNVRICSQDKGEERLYRVERLSC